MMSKATIAETQSTSLADFIVETQGVCSGLNGSDDPLPLG